MTFTELSDALLVVDRHGFGYNVDADTVIEIAARGHLATIAVQGHIAETMLANPISGVTNHSSDDSPGAFGTIETGVVLHRDGSIDSYGYVAVVDRREVLGWARPNGAGEIAFRQAGHPANDAGLPGEGWRPLVLAAVGHEPDSAWEDDNVQFPRLIAELEAAGAFTDEVVDMLCDSMDLARSSIDELIERADDAWERAKGNR